MRKLITILLLLTSFSCLGISKAEVYRLLLKHEVQHPKIVLRQALLESDSFKSYAARKRNNIFGFLGGKMRFESIVHCIKYYKLWQSKRYKSGNYYTFLKNVPVYDNGRIVNYLPYAEDKHYTQKLKRIKI